MQTIGRERMGVNHRLAAIELFENRIVVRIAEPFVADIGDEIDAIGVERT